MVRMENLVTRAVRRQAPPVDTKRLSELMDGDNKDKLKCINIIADQIELGVENDGSLDDFLQSCISPSNSNEYGVVSLAASTLGDMLAEWRGDSDYSNAVKIEAERAIRWLQADQSDNHRYSALVLIDALASKTPDVFYECILNSGLQVDFFQLLAPNMFSSKTKIREACASAIGGCLTLLADRERQVRERWYLYLYKQATENLGKERTDSVHGALLLVPFLVSKISLRAWKHLKDICSRLRPSWESKSSMLQSALIKGLPPLIDACVRVLQGSDNAYLSESTSAAIQRKSSAFAIKFIDNSLEFLQMAVARDRIRDDSMFSIVKVVWLLPEQKSDKLTIWLINNIHKQLTDKKIKAETETILACITDMAPKINDQIASKSQILPQILESLFTIGLSTSLISALQTLAIHVESLQGSITNFMLDRLKLDLQRLHPKILGYRTDSQPPLSDDKALPEVLLALNTLATFEFGDGDNAPSQIVRLELIKEVVVPYLACWDPSVRKAVLLACAKHLTPALSMKYLKEGPTNKHRLSDFREFHDMVSHSKKRDSSFVSKLVSQITVMMLRVAVSDSTPLIRLSTLCSLDDPVLDEYLATNGRLLVATLHDEQLEVKLTGVKIIGRLLNRNSKALMPDMLAMFTQLISILHAGSEVQDNDNLLLLAYFAHYAKPIVSAHAQHVLQIVLHRLPLAGPGRPIRYPLCLVIGELMGFAPQDLATHHSTIVKSLLRYSQAASSKIRRAAMTALCKVVDDASSQIKPYEMHPELFGILVAAASNDIDPAVRSEAIRALGIIGTPNSKLLLSLRSAVHGKPGGHEAETEVLESGLFSAFAMHAKKGTNDYYLIAAINALLRIALDHEQSVHHVAVFQALMVIIDFHQSEVLPHLSMVLKAMVAMIRFAHDINNESFIFMVFQFVKVVSFGGSEINGKNAVSIVTIVLDFWEPSVPLIELLRASALYLRESIRGYLPTIVQLMKQAIIEDNSADLSVTTRVMSLLPDFGQLLEGWLDVLLPQIAAVISNPSMPVEVREEAIDRVTLLATSTSVRGSAVVLFYPLLGAIEDKSELWPCAMTLLDKLMTQMGPDYMTFGFHAAMLDVITSKKLQSITYEQSVLNMLSNDRMETIDEINETDLEFTNSGPFSNRSEKTVISLSVDQHTLQEAWFMSANPSADDWSAWLQRLSGAFLKTSPCPALRACSLLAEYLPSLSGNLFNAAFVSCWDELYPDVQEDLMITIEKALKDETMQNNDVKLILLNLAEFMQFMDKGQLPISEDVLGYSAYIANAYEKSLFYKEREFQSCNAQSKHTLFIIRTRRATQQAVVQKNINIKKRNRQSIEYIDGKKGSLDTMLNSLIDIMELNNLLRLPQSSVGCMTAIKDIPEIAESFSLALPQLNTKICQWDQTILQCRKMDALSSRASGLQILSYMRCLNELFMWEELQTLISSVWTKLDDTFVHLVAPLACSTALHTMDWDSLQDYATKISEKDLQFLYLAIAAIHRGDLENAHLLISKSRSMIVGSPNGSSIGIQSEQVVAQIPHAQTLCDLEDIILIKQNRHAEHVKTSAQSWTRRLFDGPQDVAVWHRTIKLWSLGGEITSNYDVQLKFVQLCQRSSWSRMTHRAIVDLLGGVDPITTTVDDNSVHPTIMLTYLKYLWKSGKCDKAVNSLKALAHRLSKTSEIDIRNKDVVSDFSLDGLRARCSHTLANWQYLQTKENFSEESINEIIKLYLQTTMLDPNWNEGWVSLAMVNYHIVVHQTEKGLSPDTQYIVDALKGFFRGISLSTGDTLQHTLRLLQLWFNNGDRVKVQEALTEGYASVATSTWVKVLPQFVARMSDSNKIIRQSIYKALSDINWEHPHLVITPLLVAASGEQNQREVALKLIEQTRAHRPLLVEQATAFNKELVRVAFLWHEQWHAALQEASGKFFDESNVVTMMDTLSNLYKKLQTPETLNEAAFVQSFGSDLQHAADHMKLFQNQSDINEVHNAWGYYYQVFQKLSLMLPKLTELHLSDVSMKLQMARDLDIAVPGTYDGYSTIVRIEKFNPNLQVIASKQRPRKLSLQGSDGQEYTYLLKSQEDLRADERVMAFFELVNSLFDPSEFKHAIRTYSVTPLSSNAGLIGWVHNCDILHSLIVRYRKKHDIILHAEQMYMKKAAPATLTSEGRPTDDGFDQLTLLQKTEIFDSSLAQTSGDDLAYMLWFTSRDLETWHDRRTTYTTSLAVMSMVGYILGLGDRHPSNIMIDRISGEVQHIDFGDCFEVAQQREKYPERVPFRLTRILVNAFEVGGIEGIFKATCEQVMLLLRNNKDSLMAILELFVYDPLLDWRLQNRKQSTADRSVSPLKTMNSTEDLLISSRRNSLTASRRTSFSHLPTSMRIQSGMHSHLSSTLTSMNGEFSPYRPNLKAVDIITRVKSKLEGRDFDKEKELEVADQVERLIKSATSTENLCVQFMGWCPYW